MKLRNKKTGEIHEIAEVMSLSKLEKRIVLYSETDKCNYKYNSLAELNEEWEDVPEEEWRDVLGFEELYQVSNLGKVRTVKNGEEEMSQQENRNGYMTVHLRNKGVERRAMVHRLVAEAFIPNPDELRDVNHKNGDKSDNRVENLEWVSHSDNMTHSFRELGKNVRHIVQIGLDGTFIERWNSIAEAAEATGICRTDIGACCRGERTMAGAFDWKYEEDYEEPKWLKDYWFIDSCGSILKQKDDVLGSIRRELGNYFETREEAEKAVEKLEAWKRLKDKGLVIKTWRHTPDMNLTTGSFLKIEGFIPAIMENMKDLDLLFGGEE